MLGKNKPKKLNEKDVGLAQDLLFAIKNLVAAENHCRLSFVLTKAEIFRVLEDKIRRRRSALMDVIVKKNFGHAWCFTPNTMIIKKGEISEINRIKLGDKVLTHKGRFRKVSHIFKREIDEEISSITTNYSNIKIDVTKNHPFYVASNLRKPQTQCWKKNYKLPEFVWKNASDLIRSDFIFLPRYSNVKNIDEINIDYDNGLGFSDNITIPLNEDVMSMIGFYLAEGHHTERRNKKGYPEGNVGFAFSHKEIEFVEGIRKSLYSYFGSKVNHIKRESTIELCSGKRTVREFFEPFGNYAHTKRIPNWIVDLPEEKLIPLVKSMFQGDGCVGKNELSYFTVSRDLAFSLRLILNKLGILCNISLRELPKKNSIINGREIISRHKPYTIRVSGESAKDLCKILGFQYDGGKKTSGNFGYVGKDYFLIPILKVENKCYKGTVYNLEVEEDNSYCLFNGAVHNCVTKHLSAASMGLEEVGCRFNQSKHLEDANSLYSMMAETDLDIMELNEIEGDTPTSA